MKLTCQNEATRNLIRPPGRDRSAQGLGVDTLYLFYPSLRSASARIYRKEPMRKKDQRFRSRVQAELAYDQLERADDLKHFAINDLVKGNVKWLTGDFFELGVSRLTSPFGGVALVKCCDEPSYTTTHYLDDLIARKVKELEIGLEAAANADLHRLVWKARDMRDMAYEKKGRDAHAVCPENVREVV